MYTHFGYITPLFVQMRRLRPIRQKYSCLNVVEIQQLSHTSLGQGHCIVSHRQKCSTNSNLITMIYLGPVLLAFSCDPMETLYLDITQGIFASQTACNEVTLVSLLSDPALAWITIFSLISKEHTGIKEVLKSCQATGRHLYRTYCSGLRHARGQLGCSMSAILYMQCLP